MTIKKIVFLEPKTEKLHIYSKFELPRIGSVLLATIMKNEGYDTKVYFRKTNEIIDERIGIEADLVAISTITTTAPAAFRLAEYYRKLGILVVIGGPHVTALPDEAVKHANYCIRGEGEVPLPKLVAALNNQSLLENVPSLTWVEAGKIRSTEMCKPIEDLDSLPFPDFSLLDTGGKKMNGIMLKSTIPMQASRGCPFDCKFCSVTSMFGKKFRFRSVESIIQEMKQYDPKKHVIFFYDDNFSANKKRTKHLLREMIAHKKEFGGIFRWSTQVRVDIAKDPELLDLMKKAGCATVYVGIESINPESLKEMKKAQTVRDIELGIQEIRKRRIHIHGMFVFGFDNDTKASTQATVDFAIKSKIETAQFLILTPLPGTEFYRQVMKEDRFINDKWAEYDTHHVKFKPKPAHFTLWELQQAQISAHGQFYKLSHVFRRFIRGSLVGLIVGLYANRLNRNWVIWEKPYLKWLKRISADNKPAIKYSIIAT